MKRYKHVELPDGTVVKREKDFMKLMKLYYLKYTNCTQKCGPKNLPAFHCQTTTYPDYLALYSQRNTYHTTENTAIAWFEFDDTIDGAENLFDAIYKNKENELKKYEERFKGVKYYLTPDYSLCGDALAIDNEYRVFKSRLVGIWLHLVMKGIVIPTITFPTEESLEWFLDGLEECTVVAFSTKGYINNKEELFLLKEAIRRTVDKLKKLEVIIVYDCCGDYETALNIFEYAISNGIKVIVPPNTLKERNIIKKEGKKHAC